MTGNAIFESPLARAFLEDHQSLTRGLADLREAIASNDVPQARLLAERLDRSAGGHMKFEEQVLYPRVAQVVGAEYVDRLYGEHRLGKDAVRRILALPDSNPLPSEEQAALLANLETVGEHVLSCGTLLSHLITLDVPAQARMLDQLTGFRQESGRWTQLRSPGDPEGGPEHGVGDRDPHH